jgi:hypothetical protein
MKKSKMTDKHPMEKLAEAVSIYAGAGNALIFKAAKEACEWWNEQAELIACLEKENKENQALKAAMHAVVGATSEPIENKDNI